MEHIVVNQSVHTACKQHQRVDCKFMCKSACASCVNGSWEILDFATDSRNPGIVEFCQQLVWTLNSQHWNSTWFACFFSCSENCCWIVTTSRRWRVTSTTPTTWSSWWTCCERSRATFSSRPSMYLRSELRGLGENCAQWSEGSGPEAFAPCSRTAEDLECTVSPLCKLLSLEKSPRQTTSLIGWGTGRPFKIGSPFLWQTGTKAHLCKIHLSLPIQVYTSGIFSNLRFLRAVVYTLVCVAQPMVAILLTHYFLLAGFCGESKQAKVSTRHIVPEQGQTGRFPRKIPHRPFRRRTV